MFLRSKNMKIFEADLTTNDISLLMTNANQEDLKRLVDYNLKAKQEAFYAVGKVSVNVFLDRKVNFLGSPDLDKEEIIWIRNAGKQQTSQQCLATSLKIKNILCPKLKNKEYSISDFAKAGRHLPKAITIKL